MLVDLHKFWGRIEHVLLDMDGTLLDKHFDDYFWATLVPETYAEKHGLELDLAREELSARFKSREGTLEWADLDFWSEELGLDIPALKLQIEHLIAVHPYVLDFIDYCRKANKCVCLVTNAHGKTLDIKMAKTALWNHFDKVICSQQIGVAKEEPIFWERLKDHIDYDPARTMLADDTEEVLVSAEKAGIENLVYVAKPSSKMVPIKSARFHSITYFKELIIS
ncbi:MAG: HAD hydrolase-like protein [Desulfurivibrionaceae bacterium]|nr:HAD hydrolase-like protein [Desulfobulbales bacterium]MDT8334659.1 HAD hydrolase-like protein [Desulfurivibrionaceae bacterium]